MHEELISMLTEG